MMNLDIYQGDLINVVLKAWPGLFLVIIAKCKEEREKLRKEHK